MGCSRYPARSMRVFAIGDPHLSETRHKPMDIFGPAWAGHRERFLTNWKRVVTGGDLVIVPGDVSWAMTLAEAAADLELIGGLPGRKVIIRGNHDYWWSAIGKVRAALPTGMWAIQNDSVVIDGVAVAGTRGWTCPGSPEFTDEDQRIYEREVHRLALSLATISSAARGLIVALHFPPTNSRLQPSGFTRLIEALHQRPDAVVYGHLHGSEAVRDGVSELNGIRYHLVACDQVDFTPVQILSLPTS